MKRRTLNTGDAPKVVVEAKRDLTISGWAQSAVAVETDVDAELMMEQNGNVVAIVGDRALHVQMPHAATCIVESCGGQAIVRQITGSISLGSVGGNLILEAVGGPDAPVHVESVGGELSADDVGGALVVQLVGGHGVVTDVAGSCVLDQVGGHLELNRIGAGFRAEVGGNASLDFTPAPGESYSVEAGGSILCTLPDDANAELSMESPVFAAKGDDDGRQILLGEGEATIRLEAGGAIRLNHPGVSDGSAGPSLRARINLGEGEGEGEEMDFELDLEEFGILAESFATDLTAKITAKLGLLSERLPGMLSSAGLSGQEVDDISRKVQEATQRAAEKAQSQAHRAAEKATRKAERKLAKARRKAARQTHRARVVPPPSPPRPPRAPSAPSPGSAATGFKSDFAPGPKSTPVSEEERILILRMLAEKKISVAQAEELLAALDGRKG